MAGGFGYQRYPQRPTPSGEAVGMALMQRGQMMGGGMGSPDEGGRPEPVQEAPDADDGGQGLRMQGASRMGGPGQMHDVGMDDDSGHSMNAINVAVGEALTRMGGGYRTNPNAFKDETGHLRQLMQLGLSPVEAQLLIKTGGV